ncbi:MAG: transposase, partial [Candidatus Sericytochromatia bacterium]|nr:transposase [Candidatus Sericytochromatia bacterium]
MLSNGHTANERFYAWCAVGSQFVGYRLLDTRSAEGAATLLGSFSGTLMVDGLTSYPAAAKGAAGEPPKWLTVNCHAHARRKFVECEQHAPDESRFVIDLYQQLYAIERAGREPGADLAALRAAQSRPLVDQL